MTPWLGVRKVIQVMFEHRKRANADLGKEVLTVKPADEGGRGVTSRAGIKSLG